MVFLKVRQTKKEKTDSGTVCHTLALVCGMNFAFIKLKIEFT